MAESRLFMDQFPPKHHRKLFLVHKNRSLESKRKNKRRVVLCIAVLIISIKGEFDWVDPLQYGGYVIYSISSIFFSKYFIAKTDMEDVLFSLIVLIICFIYLKLFILLRLISSFVVCTANYPKVF